MSAIETTSKVSAHTARITATVTNTGTASAPASTTAFLLDGTKMLGSVATPSIPAGSSVTVSMLWDTKGVKGQHVIAVTCDSAGVVDELDEGNNLSSLTVSVKDNVVKRVSFKAGP